MAAADQAIIVVGAIVGGGLVTGILFAFSNFALRALEDLPAEQGMHTMQRINERIQNPVFLALFFGTPVLCVLIIVATLGDFDVPGAPVQLFGALTYLAGPFAITVARNVPLNNRLADAATGDAGTVWPSYRRDWQRWNHVRSYLGIVSLMLLAAGAYTG